MVETDKSVTVQGNIQGARDKEKRLAIWMPAGVAV